MEPLGISKQLFTQLGAQGVGYIHWKSNEHLLEAVSGETDLDLLIDTGSEPSFSSILQNLGFLGLILPRAILFPGRNGYLGFDEATGRLIHLDVHHQLVLGQQNAKNHHLPIESWLMTDSSEQLGVAVPASDKEFLILYIRIVLKTTVRQRLRSVVDGGSPVPDSIQKEIAWLANRTNELDLRNAAETCGLAIAPDEILEFKARSAQDGLDRRYLSNRKRSLLRRLGRFRREPRLPAFVRMILVRVRRSRPLRRVGLGVPPKKLPFVTPLIAVVGPDGAGKTRLTRDLESWLSWKLATRHVYFGQPRSSVVFRALNKPGSILRGIGAPGSGDRGGGGVLAGLAHLFEPLKWTYLARRRYRLYGRSLRLCRAGEVVIAERFPLEEFHEMHPAMDGPRLQSATSWWPRMLARYEHRQYQAIGRPDLIIGLNAPLEVLRTRKDDLGIEEHAGKVESVQRLTLSPDVIGLNAKRPYSEVLLQAKDAIWSALRDAS